MKKIAVFLLAVLIAVSAFTSCGDKTPSVSNVTLKPGDTVQLFAEGFEQGAEITWTSDKEEIVTVSADGKVTYVSEGKATVTAKSGDKKKTYSILCLKDGLDGIVFDTIYKNLLSDGESFTITPTLLNVTDKVKSWKSSDETAATVKDGKVTRVGAGRAEITAETVYGYTATCYVMCDSIVMTVGDTAVTDSMYGYWVASYKTQLIEYNIGSDDETIWSTVLDEENGKTFKDMFDDNVYDSVVQMVKAVEAYKQSHPDAEKDVEEAVNEQIAAASEQNGGDENLEKILANFYVDTSIVKKIFTYEEITNRFFDSLFVEGSELEVTDKEAKDYFYGNYTHVKHVFFDLNYSFDESGNYYQISEEESEEKRLLAADVYDKIKSGKLDYDKAIDKYSDDTEEYKDGFVFSDGSQVKEFNDAAFDMEIGEIRLVETSYGLHIMKRLALKDSDLDEATASDIREMIKTERFDKYIKEKDLEVKADKDALKASWDVVTMPMFSSFSAE